MGQDPTPWLALGAEVFHILMAFTTVSYTHLRAHETVLDLVCRLPLEKTTNRLYDVIYLLLYVPTYIHFTPLTQEHLCPLLLQASTIPV